ncbi:unnamed protein product [Rhizoctonia solani]|uniref:Exportin-1/Importin-beta-like domain-containing protein n=1 Tax=Rhizoctonia solani TaxID=456999 RepID=A0A8H3H7W3_9AGAM|nr:unnamed protein product [Rhizoctonia solani]
MAQSASVQAVIEAISVFGSHTDKNSIDAASKWLQDFQHNITYDFHQVDPAHREGLRNSLIAVIQQYATGPRVVLVQICLALSAFVLQYPEWTNPIADLIGSLGQQPSSVPALLEFLTIVAEEVTTNSRIPISNEDFRNRTDQLLTNNSSQVLNLLTMYIQAPGVTPAVQSQVFRCVKSWLRTGELSPTELAQSPLFVFSFDALETEQLFDSAVDVICDIIHETQEVDDYLPIIEQITARLIAIKPKLAAVGDDSDKMRGYTRVFAEAGETYRALIVSHIETFQPIVEAILECASYPDLDVVPITFQFWYHFAMTSRSRRDSVSPVITDIYQRLTAVMIDHLRFPADFDELPAQERDEFRDFRHIMGDTLKDCCYVLGSSLCLSRTYEMIMKILGAPASNQAWQDIEAPLFAMRSMGAEIPPTDEEVVPRIMDLVVQLPAHPKVRYAATLVVSRYTEWVALHPPYIPGLLEYISTAFDDSDKEVVAAAGQALRFLCKDCNRHLTSYFAQLHSFVQTISPKISQSDRVEIYEGIAHVISAMSLQDAGTALKQMSLELLQKIHEAASAPSASKVQTDAICDGVELLLTMLEVIGPFGEELPASCEDTCSQAWAVVDTVLTHHGGDPTVSESVCRLVRAAIPLFGNSALPVMPLVIKRAVLNFDQTGIASYPWILRKCIEAHGHTGKVALREDFKQAFELVSTKLSSLLQTQPITSVPDVLEDYTALAMIMLQYTPDLLLLSSVFPITIQVLLACLSLVQPEAIDAGVDFAYALLGHDALNTANPSPPPNFPLYATAIRNAVGPHGAQLVSVLLNGLSGTYPEDVASPVVISRYTEWVALHPSYIPGLLEYISTAFDDSDKEVVAAAGQALRFLCKDCNRHLTSYFAQLHSFVQTISPKISQSDRVEIYEGIAHVISAMSLQDAGTALKQMSLELLQKIHEAASAPPPASKAQTDAICDGVELVLTMLEIVGPFGEDLPASCEDTCSQAWAVIDTVLSHHGGDPAVSESICRLIRVAIPLFGDAALPVIPLVIKRAVLNFGQTGIASYPWILRKCIEAHGHTGKVALREDFKQAFELVSTKLSNLLQTQAITSIPDVLEDYTALAMIMLQYTPDLLLLSSAFPVTIQVLLACLSLVQPEAIDAGVDFAYALLGHDALDAGNPSPPPNFPLYATAIRNAVAPHGAQLVSVLLNGLSGTYPEDVTSPVVSVTGELAKIWPNEFALWITTAVELLPTSSVHPTVKSTLLSDISNAKQPQGVKKAVTTFHRSNSKMRERRRDAVTPQQV